MYNYIHPYRIQVDLCGHTRKYVWYIEQVHLPACSTADSLADKLRDYVRFNRANKIRCDRVTARGETPLRSTLYTYTGSPCPFVFVSTLLDTASSRYSRAVCEDSAG